jgi:excisionase family DNA binding protein
MSDQTTIEPLLLTANEAAEALAIGRSKVYELIMSGELESVRIGGCRRVPADALVQFVAGLRSPKMEAE